MDMLRFHKFTVGGAWVPEYGNPDLAEDFKFIYKYFFLHNIRFPEGTQWPFTLMMTVDNGHRVIPCHTLKYLIIIMIPPSSSQRSPTYIRKIQTSVTSSDQNNPVFILTMLFFQGLLVQLWAYWRRQLCEMVTGPALIRKKIEYEIRFG